MEYIKVLLHKNKMVGAILIGETDLEVSSMPYPFILLMLTTSTRVNCLSFCIIT